MTNSREATRYEPDIYVTTVMETPVQCIDAHTTLREAALAMRTLDVGAMVIMKGGDITGIVSERDIVWAIGDGADPDKVVVADVMSEWPRYVTAADEVRPALEIMLTAGIRHLPVIDDAEVVGIVSIRDLVAAMIDGRPSAA